MSNSENRSRKTVGKKQEGKAAEESGKWLVRREKGLTETSSFFLIFRFFCNMRSAFRSLLSVTMF